MPYKWPKEDVDRLFAFAKEGKTRREIAEIMGGTEKAISAKMVRVGLRAPLMKWKKPAIDKAMWLYRGGASFREIGEALGVNHDTARKLCNRVIASRGEQRRGAASARTFTRAEVASARKMAAEGWTFHQIKIAMKTGADACRRLLDDNDIKLIPRQSVAKPRAPKPRSDKAVFRLIRGPTIRPTPVKTLATAWARNISFEELRRFDCRFPTHTAISGIDDATFCGQPAAEGSSYCPSCHALVYQKRAA